MKIPKRPSVLDTTMPAFDMFAGLTSLELEDDAYDLGEGLTIAKTYGHVMAPFTMAFKRPAEYDSSHPGPWKSMGGGFAYDIEAELKIPAALRQGKHAQMEIGRALLFLIRLGVDVSVRLPAFANHSFSEMEDVPEHLLWLRPFDFEARYFPLDSEIEMFDQTRATWVAGRWQTVLRLSEQDASFLLAREALDRAQFVQSTELTLVSVWAALEALFSPSTSELKFRVSALIAAFLEPPGDERLALQRRIAKLYDKRSAAAHGKPTHDDEHLLESINLLGTVLRKMIDQGNVPSKEALERALFGAPT